MSRPDPLARLAAAVHEVDRLLQIAAVMGRASGAQRLRSRLAALDPTPSLNAISIEVRIWSTSIDKDLHPDVRAVVLGALRCDPRGTWLDPDARLENEAAALDALVRGLMDVRAMRRRHLASGSVSHLRDATSTLESLTHEYRAALAAAPARDECPGIADLLDRSLATALQPTAVSIYVADVRERVRSTLSGQGRRDRGRDDDQWFSREPWIHSTLDEVNVPTEVFTGELQIRFEMACKEIERVRRTEADRQEKARAELDAWEARRKAEAAHANGAPIPPDDRIADKRETERRRRDDHAARLRREIDPRRLRDPDSLATMSLEQLLLVKEHLDWDGRHDAELARRELDRKEYEARLGRY